jgi:citronellol/citronellal dehydrogenase
VTAADAQSPALLRPGVLEGRVIAVAGGAAAVAEACAALGAATPSLDADLLDEERVAAAAAALGPVDALVCDAGGPFMAAGGGIAGLRRGVDGAFNAARAVARAAWIDTRPGKVILIAPARGAGEHAGAAAAALENLARTLSVEWARRSITATAILPGAATTADEVAQLAAFLASPAGDYYSGCAFTLGGAGE